MRMVHLTPWYWDSRSVLGGAERYVRNIAHAQVDLFPTWDIRVYGLASIPRPLSLGSGPVVRLYPVGDPRRDASSVIAEAMAEGPVDVWHVHQHRSPFGMAALFLLSSLNQPIVATDLGWVLPWDTRGMRVSDLADAVVSISEYADGLVDTNVPRYVIRGGVLANVVSQGMDGSSLLYVGRILPHKGVRELVEAMPAGMPLIVAGAVTDADWASAVERICRKKGFQFIPNASDDVIDGLRQQAGIGLVPTRIGPGYEYMGLAALESLASGTPVGAMDSGGLREFVEQGVNGFLTQDHGSLVVEAKRLLGQPDALSRLADGARESAQKYCCHSVARQLDSVYQSVLERH